MEKLALEELRKLDFMMSAFMIIWTFRPEEVKNAANNYCSRPNTTPEMVLVRLTAPFAVYSSVGQTRSVRYWFCPDLCYIRRSALGFCDEPAQTVSDQGLFGGGGCPDRKS